MTHRSISPIDPSPGDAPDPFWADVPDRSPRLLDHLPRPERSWAVGAVGLLLVAAVGWWLVRPAAAPIESAVPLASTAVAGASPAGGAGSAAGGSATGVSATAAGAASSTTVPQELVVQVAGQVQRPGLYRLPLAARIDDLIRRAGGFAAKADRDRVNLAAPVADGQRIWIPARGERHPPDLVTGADGGSGGGGAPIGGSGGSGTSKSASTVTPADPVDLNTATADQLDALPGVGPATAAAILAYRQESGRFNSVDDLLEVRGIGDAKLEQLRPLVHV